MTLECRAGYVSTTDGCDAGRAHCVKSCGGIAGLACPSGYVCQLPANPIPDQLGTCRKADSAEDNCDNTGGQWRDDDPNAQGEYCDCPTFMQFQPTVGCVADDETACDQTGGAWRDDDPNADGLFCDCPSGTKWESGKGCAEKKAAPKVTCLTLTCASGFHCCAGPLTADGPLGDATCMPDSSFCPL
jgi:hypothetical protein